MAKTTRQTAVKITRDLLTKAIVYNCPRYTRNGGVGVPSHACADLDGGFTNCPGAAGLCTHVSDIFKTMVKIKNGEITV